MITTELMNYEEFLADLFKDNDFLMHEYRNDPIVISAYAEYCIDWAKNALK